MSTCNHLLRTNLGCFVCDRFQESLSPIGDLRAVPVTVAESSVFEQKPTVGVVHVKEDGVTPNDTLEQIRACLGDPTRDHIGIRGSDGHADTVISAPSGVKITSKPIVHKLASALSREQISMRMSKARARQAYLSLAHFVRQAWHLLEPGPLVWGWHIEAICYAVQKMLEEWLRGNRETSYEMLCQNMTINVPPGTLKSRILMVFAPAWMWLRAPAWSLLAVSGTPSNVTRDSVATRDLVTSEWYRTTFQIKWTIRADVNSIEEWQTTAGGKRTSKGMATSFTGVHVDAIFLDDPDDAYKVYGDAARAHTEGQWSAMGSRVNSLERCIRIISQQRVHEDDLTGRQQAKRLWSLEARDGWVVFALPVEFDPTRACKLPWGWYDPRTVEGQVLHEERFSIKVLDAERIRLGSFGFAAQYNQNPQAADGEFFNRKWFGFFRFDGVATAGHPRPQGCRDTAARIIPMSRGRNPRPIFEWWALSVDASFGDVKDTASNVGLQVWAGIGADRFLVKDDTKARTFIDTCAAIAVFDESGGTKTLTGGLLFEFLEIRETFIEKKANGAAVIEALQAHVSGVLPIEPEGGKKARAAAVSPQVQSGNVYLYDGAHWLDVFLAEVCGFPNAKKDDRTDTMTQILNHKRHGSNIWAGATL